MDSATPRRRRVARAKTSSHRRSGAFFSDQLFSEVALFTDSWHKSEGEPEYELFGNLGEPDSGLLFTYRLMEERVFSHARGRFRT